MICAHRGLPSAELFSRLDELKKHDLFYIHVLNQVHAYEVDDIQIIKPEDMKYIHFESKRSDHINDLYALWRKYTSLIGREGVLRIKMSKKRKLG